MMLFQKSLAVVLVSLVVLSLTACGNKNKGSSGYEGTAVVPLDIDQPIEHDPNLCPKFSTGYYTYGREDRRVRRGMGWRRQAKEKVVIVTFADGETRWVVDGSRQEMDKIVYRAYCSKNILVIDYYRDGMRFERVEYFRNEKNQLVLRRQPQGKTEAGKPTTEGTLEVYDLENKKTAKK